MKSILRSVVVTAALVAAQCPTNLVAQVNDWVDLGGSNDFADGNNWSFAVQPDEFFEVSRIGSDPGFAATTNPTATVSTNLAGIPSSALVLGDGTGFEGTLDIISGGTLVTSAGFVSQTGNLTVGVNGGTGFLNVSGTGVLNVGGLLQTDISGDAASTIALSGAATVTADSAIFNNGLQVIGSDVSFSTTGSTVFQQNGVHEWEFAVSGGSAGTSALSVAGQATLDGVLKLDTMGGTPAVGDSFALVDSATVAGSFSGIDIADVPNLGLGVQARVESAAGGTNGVVTSVLFEQQPVLTVNRQTGAVSIQNPGSASTVAFDTYTVGSGNGSLSQANWTPLADSSSWQEANPSANALSELNPIDTETIGGSTSISLGNIFQPASGALGDDNEDITFTFAPDGQGNVSGIVVYEGIPTDNLTLNVDRTTGQAQIINGFGSAVSLDTYTVTSESDALDTAGFAPIGGDFQVAISDTGTVSEINPLDSLDLATGEAQALGALFDFDAVGAEEDFVFRFTLPDENFFRTGRVVFDDELTVLETGGLDGDYDDDGVVSAADYSLWRGSVGGSDAVLSGNGTGDASGLVVQADYDLWRASFGNSSLPASAATAAAAVPEPASALLVALGLSVAGARRGSRGPHTRR